MGPSIDQFSLPPLEALSFLPFLFAQAVLLHPSIPASISRPARLALFFPAAYLSFVAPFRHRITPLHYAIGANFRWGIFGPYFVLKAVEWGFAEDASAYTWIGFDEVEATEDMLVEPVVREEKSASGKPNGSAGVDSTTRTNGTTKLYEPDIGTRGAPALVKSSQKSYAASHPSSPLTIFLDSFHLLTSLRGFGYAFGPPSHHRHPRKHSLHFLRSALASLAISHLISITCLALIIHRHSAVPSLLSHLSLPLRALQPTANVLSYLAVGVSLHAQMETGFAMASIAFVVGTAILRALLPPAFRPAPFDSREFPPLFDTPYKPKSVTKFWSAQWHALFRKPFLSVGYDPVTRLVSRALGKHAGRAIGAFTVFALSAWMHDQALCSARHLLPAGPPLSFSLRYGGWIFFLSQGVAVFLEGVFTRLTGRRVRGGVGLAWSYFCIVGLGLLAGRSWIALGLVEGLPEVQRWGWQRFVVPSAALAPPPLWMV